MNPSINPSVNYKESDVPVMPHDRSMRINHTNQSVNYNLGHTTGHVKGVIDSIKKMSSVSPRLAKQTQTKAVGHMTKMVGMMKSAAPRAVPHPGTLRPMIKGGGMKTPKVGGMSGYLSSRKFGAKGISKVASAGRAKGMTAKLGRRR